MYELSEDSIDHILMHSSTGGRHAALLEVVNLLNSRAGLAFTQGKDDEARLIRSLASEVDKLRAQASKNLSIYAKGL